MRVSVNEWRTLKLASVEIIVYNLQMYRQYICKYVLSICKLLLFFCTVCPYVNCCCCFFCTVWSTKCSSAVFCTVCPYVNCLLFFLHWLSICKLFVFFCTVCPYVNCLLFFCTVWSTLIRISLTKALVLW